MAAPLLLLLACAIGGAGCASAVSAGTNTALSGEDLVRMTDRMAQSMAAAPGVREAIAREGRLRIVMQPVENYMTGEVLPRGASQAFVARVRELLAAHDPGHYQWVMNRGDYYDFRRRELEVRDLGPNPDAINPDYALTARFDSLTNETSEIRSSGYLCVYQLIDLRTREVLWTDKYEVRKRAVKGFLD